MLETEHGTLLIKGEEIPTVTKFVDQSILRFWIDNPRVYSLVHQGDAKPDQDEVYQRLREQEHVRGLKDDIEANGGLIDPLIVRQGDMVVLEGNSRLAAYRHLASVNVLKWGNVRCTLLPEDVEDRLVFALLGQYHVKGKKDWAPFEKAGFLFRRHKEQKIALSVVAGELGMSPKAARHLVDVFEFMIAHGETDRDKWSYYDEYLKSTKIRKAREEHPDFDDLIVNNIKSGKIRRAMDLRDKLPTICKAPKVLKKYVSKKVSFEDAYEDSKFDGGESAELQRMKRFRSWLADAETIDDILNQNRSIRQKWILNLNTLRSGLVKSVLQLKSGKMPWTKFRTRNHQMSITALLYEPQNQFVDQILRRLLTVRTTVYQIKDLAISIPFSFWYSA